MSKYVKREIENLMKVGSDNTLFSDSKKKCYPSPWWKFWEKRKIRSEISSDGCIGRKFDKKGNLIEVSYGKDSLDVKSKIITREISLSSYDPRGNFALRRILRTFPNGTYEESNYFRYGERHVLKGIVDDDGMYQDKTFEIFDAEGRLVDGGRFCQCEPVIAKGKLKGILQKRLSAEALKEKARKLDGLKGTNRINRSKELYSKVYEEMDRQRTS